ncbi:AAA family ATPase [Nocardia abscessus]|uniref:AAA family ATPase n=1 Tax=Nocardia abscessus TaxID=120957 RepID=UPI002454C777|nr:AAA family ATPase [Nocardia abscessus]
MLYGREDEQARIRALLDNAREGRGGGALFITGEPGAGKSALLDLAAEMVGNGWRVLRCTGIQSEAELPFAGLQMLVSAPLCGVDALPERQRDALRAAFGSARAHSVDDRFLVGIGIVSLLTEVSNAEPVLCLVDDAQWLDRPSADTVLFAARRLGERRIVVLIAGRPEFSAPSLPILHLPPLDSATARRLLSDRVPGLPPEVRDRVLATAAGNPLALLELPRMDIAALSAEPLPLTDRLQLAYQAQIADQPESVRTALLVAAAEDSGDLTLVVRVLLELGSTIEAVGAAEQAGMVTVTGQSIAFRHPLKRAAAYRIAPFTQRLTVHAAIAAALTDQPDRRAWHLAAATTGPDETVAALLEATAQRANHRTGTATAVTALARAAGLSPDPADRRRRLLLAVEAAADAGQPERALRLADEMDGSMTPWPSGRARLALVRARIEVERGSLRAAHALLTGAASDIASIAPDQAAESLIHAAMAAWIAGSLREMSDAHTAIAALPLGRRAEKLLAVLEGPIALHSSDPARGVRLIRALVRSRCTGGLLVPLTVALQANYAGDVGDARDILLRLAGRCRESGMVGWMPAVGNALGTVEMLLGHLRDAEAALAESHRIAEEVDQRNRVSQARSVLAILAAIRGEERQCRELADHCLRRSTADSSSIDIAHAQWALGLLDLAYGRYEAALDRFETLDASPYRAPGQWIHLMSDRVEAAVRLRSPQRATESLTVLERWSAATGSRWIEAHLLRCRGMLDGDGESFARALDLHAAEGRWFDHGRTGLLYGEWLRRERTRTTARTVLRGALQTFERLDARPWAARASIELRAAGVAAPPGRTGSPLAELLTPQELQVVRLAAAGATNKEIAGRLLLSPKTVAHHLYRAFPKLGVTNRHALAHVDLDGNAEPES